ncbi:MAG: imidazole glycerol phosphate synthase subunit HisH [Verrucomicrobiales bacterium]|nr:imidazole glycerol phosphate synthase subunit HisH [Verrucomicrobiales bacterium]
MLALIDYGSGNLRSVHKALLEAGASVKLVRHGDEITGATGLVLPGVGAFDDCMNALRDQGLLDPIRSFIGTGRPFLGICVGYQALFERSEEFQSRAPGLGIFRGPVVRFVHQPGLKVPQIGWNRLQIANSECPLYQGVPDGSHVYFVHSYYPHPADSTVVSTWTDYGGRFASSIWRSNVFGTQFHPEKSQAVGLKILRNFTQYAENPSLGGRSA